MRKHWLDNLRWFTVLLVLFYHIFYFFNNKGVFGGIGGFVDNPMKQPQDIVMYILYPWFMMLLFLLAGISARYSLVGRTTKEFVRSRTLKLLVPATIGLFVFQWTTGYFNTRVAAGQPDFSNLPVVIKWAVLSVSGTGPLWFAHDLWLFSLILLLVRKLDRNDRFHILCSKASAPVIILMGVLIYLGSQVLIFNPRNDSADGIYNLYKPLTYFIPFLMGYFVFSNESVLQRVKAMWIPLSCCAVVAGSALCITGWGQNNTSPEYLSGWLNCLYAWLMMLAMIGIFLKFFDRTDRFCDYMTRTSFGLYVLHYSVLASFGYMLKSYTSMSPLAIYIAVTIVVFALTPLLYELFRRIPFIRWAVLGQTARKSGLPEQVSPGRK